MNIVVFGLSISSAWGNGHATLLRGLFRALHTLGHNVDFFEHDVPYYAAHRDAFQLPYTELHLYSDWAENLDKAIRILLKADVGMVTSYCPDGIAASELVLSSGLARTVFYDMDTPVTLSRLDKGEAVPYLPANGLGDFDLVLSYTGGTALEQLRERLGARCAAALYGWVDPAMYYRTDPCEKFVGDLSYLGTYSADRQLALEELLIEPARRLQDRSFVVAGAMYPNIEKWPPNLRRYEHISPEDHRSFYSSSPVTLNVTRASMAAMGYCPSGRLFEAAACGTSVLSDWWPGLDAFFEPGEEILIASGTASALSVIGGDRALLERVAARARQRTLDCHTAETRARRLIDLLETPRDESNNARAVSLVARGA